MKLTQAQILERYDARDLKIALIGMSNIGKSMTAKRLAKAFDFQLIDIDSEIQKRLGQDSMEDFAGWQGQPYEPGYKDREKQSLALETDAMLAAMQQTSGNVILDTAGSVIYTSDAALRQLKDTYFVVHIAADRADIKRLQDIYFTSPKPLVWADHYQERPNLSHIENIQKCYPELLKSRAKLYAALADDRISSKFIMGDGADSEVLLRSLGT